MTHRKSLFNGWLRMLPRADFAPSTRFHWRRAALRAALALGILPGMILALPPHRAERQNVPELREVDRVRLAEAFRLAGELQDKIWKGWSKAPFAVLLVTPDYEFLIRHPQPSKDFTRVGYDSLLKSDVYFRKRVFQTTLLATFPAVNGLSTIVVGQAENTTSKTSTPWIVVLLHEHFHQWQDSDPPTNDQVRTLDLAGGDETGMWMLNYPFPYDVPAVGEKFAALSRLSRDAIREPDKKLFQQKFAAYRNLRADFDNGLAQKDYRYISFQLWKEGVARYTELRVAELGAARFHPSEAFRNLPDFTPFEQVARQLRDKLIADLSSPSLGTSKRESFYSFGAGEAMLLDRAKRPWQRRYLAEKFYLDKYF